MGVHKFDVKKALADIQAVDRGDVTEIISVRPSSRTIGRSTTAPRAVSSRQLDSELLPSSPIASVVRRASAADGRWYASPQTRDVRNTSSLSKSSEQIDGIIALDRIAPSSAMTATMPADELGGIDSKLGESVKWASASEENLLTTGSRLHDVTDIKQLARLQEESLRLSYNAPLVMSKKGLSKSLNRSSGALVLDESDSPDTSAYGLTNSLNQSSGSLLQAGEPAAHTGGTSSAKLAGSSRHTSRSAGNLLASNLSPASTLMGKQTSVTVGNSSIRCTASSVGSGQSSTLPRSGAGGLRTPRSALRTSKLQAAKPEPRSTSLHAPRSGYGPARSGTSQRNGLSVAATPAPPNSLPSSPHSSDPDSLDETGEAARAHSGHRRSVPNLGGGRTTTLSLAGRGTVGSSSERTAAALRASAQLTAMNSCKLLSQLKQLPSASTAGHPPSPPRNYRAAAQQLPLSAVSSSAAKTKDTGTHQPSRLTTPNRSRIPSPSSRRNLMSAAADDSWKDGCF